MGKAEGWGALLGAVGALIVEVAEASERRADGQGTAVCSLCRDLSSSLFPVSRGRLCPTCIAVAHLELAKDWRKLKEENDQLRALFREFDAAGMSLKEVVATMTAVVTDLKTQAADNAVLRVAASAAEAECLTVRDANAALAVQAEAAQRQAELARRQAESLQRVLEAVRAEKGADAAGPATPLVAIMLLLHPTIAAHVRDLASSSASPSMARSIEAFLESVLTAACQRIAVLEGPSLQIVDTLKNAGYLVPDDFSGRVLAWLVRRTPLISRKVGSPIIYAVHLDWFFSPPPECLEHHQVRRR